MNPIIKEPRFGMDGPTGMIRTATQKTGMKEISGWIFTLFDCTDLIFVFLKPQLENEEGY